MDDFAQRHGVPGRAFDHDHYDIAEHLIPQLVAGGAVPVASRELASRIRAAGLRVGPNHRLPRRAQAQAALIRSWTALLPDHPESGQSLLDRWQEPRRRYHDTRHLYQMLGALTQLHDGTPPLAASLAAWFHDAIYDGVPGADERASAELAASELGRLDLPSNLVSEVHRLVLLTINHRPADDDSAGSLFVNADPRSLVRRQVDTSCTPAP